MQNTKNQDNNKRIAKNTLFLYIRMLLVMIVTLYMSRIVLNLLGVVDYGIYSVVGGIVAMLGFMSITMSNVVQRFLSFEMGKGNISRVNTIFNIAIQVHACIAIIVVLVMESVGVWYLENYINIPAERLDAAHWVLQCTIFSTCFTIIQVPFNGIIIAKEDMGIYAYISIIEVLLKLGGCFLLRFIETDKLVLYSVIMAIVTILIVLIYIIYCMLHYSECIIRKAIDIPLLKRMGSFACWSFFGELSWCFKGQAVNIALNFFFGPIVNAAAAISEQINAAVSKFVINFQMAVNPQIIKTYASQEQDKTKNLLFHSIRLSSYLLLALSLPLIFEMPLILNLWLNQVPPYTLFFSQLTLVCSFIANLSNPLAQVIKAGGEIRNYQIVISIVAFLCFPFSVLALWLNFSVYSVLWINLFLSAALVYIRIWFSKKYIPISFKQFFSEVLTPIIKVSCVSVAFIFPVYLAIEDKWMNFIIVVPVSIGLVCIISYYMGMEQNEKTFVMTMFNTIFNKLVRKQ